MRISVLSDIHGNGCALEAAIQAIENDAPDQVIILGDLLTYGPEVSSVLDAVELLSRRYSTRWVLGNHEEFYFDLSRGLTTYVDSRPGWLRDTIYWTFERLDINRLASFPWEREYEIESVLFSHANPWQSWRYLRNDDDYIEAGETLRERGLAAGVFGHTHRSRLFCDEAEADAFVTSDNGLRRLSIDTSQTAVVNAGSVGQPRDAFAISTILTIDMESEKIGFTLTPLVYDIRGHLAALNRLDLPRHTKERLVSFFVPSIKRRPV